MKMKIKNENWLTELWRGSWLLHLGDDWTATLRPLVDAGDAGAGVDTDANLAVMKVPGGIRRLADLHPPLFLGVSDFSGVAAAATPLEIGRGMRDIRGAPIGLLGHVITSLLFNFQLFN